MNSDELREEALKMMSVTIPHPDAIRWTFIQIMAMIERNGFQIPANGKAFLEDGQPLVRIQ